MFKGFLHNLEAKSSGLNTRKQLGTVPVFKGAI